MGPSGNAGLLPSGRMVEFFFQTFRASVETKGTKAEETGVDVSPKRRRLAAFLRWPVGEIGPEPEQPPVPYPAPEGWGTERVP